MYGEVERIENVKEVMQRMAQGINPFDGEIIQNDSILNDARTIRCLYFVAEVLDNIMKGGYRGRYRALNFIITTEQKSKVVFPETKIGVNEFSRCVNACLNLSESKRVTGAELNKRLRKLGILGEEQTEEGKIRTVANEKSSQYGFEAEKRSYNGVEYDMVVINDVGKKYLLDNIDTIMKVEL